MFLIVGLGNPGRRYRDTPHNAGFLVCDRFASRHHLGAEVVKFQGLFRRGQVDHQDVGVLKPQTYMNRSGDSVAEAVRFLPIEPEEIFLVFDDMDLPSGKLRLRKAGGHGGHNGIRSVVDRLGTSDFARLRVHAPEMVFDLPLAGKRLIQRADGYEATIVSGGVILADGEPTGALAGKLVRGPQASA